MGTVTNLPLSLHAEHWTDEFMGIPFSEADCVELCGRVAEFFGVHPDLPHDRPDASPWTYSAWLQERMPEYVYPIVGLWDESAEPHEDYVERMHAARPREGDIALMKLRGRFCHVGIYCEPSGIPSVLHTDQAHGASVRVPINRLRYWQVEIEGYYRWRK
jgi:hypothetical protein